MFTCNLAKLFCCKQSCFVVAADQTKMNARFVNCDLYFSIALQNLSQSTTNMVI